MWALVPAAKPRRTWTCEPARRGFPYATPRSFGGPRWASDGTASPAPLLGHYFAGDAMGELVLTLAAIGALLWLLLDIIVRLSQR